MPVRHIIVNKVVDEKVQEGYVQRLAKGQAAGIAELQQVSQAAVFQLIIDKQDHVETGCCTDHGLEVTLIYSEKHLACMLNKRSWLISSCTSHRMWGNEAMQQAGGLVFFETHGRCVPLDHVLLTVVSMGINLVDAPWRTIALVTANTLGYSFATHVIHPERRARRAYLLAFIHSISGCSSPQKIN